MVTIGTLLSALVWIILSGLLVVVAAGLLAAAVGGPPSAGLVALATWLAGGGLMLTRPVESLFGWLSGCRRPTAEENSRLVPAWQEVTAAAGVDGGDYRLWVQTSDELNAFAGSRRIVAVTSHAVAFLPHRQLAAVLAHELGHHRSGHAWSGALAYWYALPARALWRLAGAVFQLLLAAAARSSLLLAMMWVLGGAAALLTVGLAAAVVAVLGWWVLAIGALLVAMAVLRTGGWSELRADRYAFSLGYGDALLAAVVSAQSARAEEAGGVSWGLRSRPSLEVRVRWLTRWLEGEERDGSLAAP